MNDRQFQEASLRSHDRDARQQAPCGGCDTICPTTEMLQAFGGSKHFLTTREVNVLAQMRRVKGEVRRIKARLGKAPGASADRETLEDRLQTLRRDWAGLDRERIDAADERMRLLGHIP